MMGFRKWFILTLGCAIIVVPHSIHACGLPLPPAKMKRELLLAPIGDERYEAIHRSLFHATPDSLHDFFRYLNENLPEYPDLQKVADIAYSWDYLSPFIKQDPALLQYINPKAKDYHKLAALALKHNAEVISYIDPEQLTNKRLLELLIQHVDTKSHIRENATDWPVGSFLTYNQTYQSLRELYAPFYEAVRAGKASEISDLIVQGGLNPDLPTFTCIFPLDVAIANEDILSVTALIEHGASPQIDTLMKVVNSKDKALFKLLLEATKQEGATVSTGRLLTEAVIQGDLELVKLLVDEGADIKQRDNFGRTLLHEAAYHGHPEVASYLISEGVDIAAVDRFTYNGTALTAAVSNPYKDNVAIVKQLIEAGFNPQKHVPEAVLFAVYYRHLDTVKTLLRAGVNIDTIVKTVRTAPYLESKTPLHIAIERNDTAMVNFLIEQGASETILDSKGRPPLHIAVLDQRPDIVKAFTEFDVNLNIRDNQGRTALHLALQSGYVDNDTLQLMMEYGARPAYYQGGNLGYVEGNLAESMQTIVRMLLESGANLNEIDKAGKTPLDYVLREAGEIPAATDQEQNPATNGTAPQQGYGAPGGPSLTY